MQEDKKEMGRFLYRFHLFSIVMHQSYDAFKPNEIYCKIINKRFQIH